MQVGERARGQAGGKVGHLDKVAGMGELQVIMKLRGAKWLRRAFRRGPGFASRLACAALAIVLVAGTVLAGSRYFYCPGMGASQFTSCCPEHRNEGGADTAQLVARSCCESKRMQPLPSAQVDARPLVATAPLVAVLAALPTRELPVVSPSRAIRTRWGGDPPTPLQVRSYLMVFLT